MPCRNVERNSLTRYTTVHLNRDGVRVPFVRLSSRWLEAFGFKEGAKFTAVGVEGGLLVLAVYDARRTAASRRVTRRARSMRRMPPHDLA